MFGRKAKRIEELERNLATALGIIGERDDVIEELDTRNKRLRLDIQRMRDRLPRLDTVNPLTLWTCPVEGHAKVEWRGDVAHCMTCERTSADPVEDEDVTRPYIDMTVDRGLSMSVTDEITGIPEYDPWKDETR